MANHASAKKRIRQIKRRTDANRRRVSTIRTYIRKVEEAIEGGDAEVARTALREAQPHMMSGVTKGVFHKNTISRKLSRLSRRINGMTS